MSWIAKNSITGKTYGKAFESIYDCQTFIDKNLALLEYEMQRCFGLEKDVIYRIDCDEKNKSIFDMFHDAFVEFSNSKSIVCLREGLSMSLAGKKQAEIDSYFQTQALKQWSSNNIIRCWNVSQKRFADGFDF